MPLSGRYFLRKKQLALRKNLDYSLKRTKETLRKNLAGYVLNHRVEQPRKKRRKLTADEYDSWYLDAEDWDPESTKEIKNIFKGAEKVIAPKFVTQFAKKPFEVSGLIRAYRTTLKGKNVVVIAPRLDPTLQTLTSPTSLQFTDKGRNLFLAPDKEKAERVKKEGLVGYFHTHPSSIAPRLFFSGPDLLNSSQITHSASLVVGSKSAKLFLPFDATKSTKLKIKMQPFNKTYNVQTIPITIKSDKEVWDLLRRVKRKK